MSEEKELVVKMIRMLQEKGYIAEEISYKFGISKQTLVNYRNGKIPIRKCRLFIDFVKENYKEVYELCI